jgi:hypothetical protein
MERLLRKGAQMVPKKQRRIEFGSPEMFRAWADGLETYDPTLRGRKLEEEGGVTRASLIALRTIIKVTGRQPDSVTVGPEGGCLFSFGDLGCYLATGFGTGYGGEGSRGFAEIAAECGFGAESDCFDVILEWPRDQQGVIFNKPADYGDVWNREAATA